MKILHTVESYAPAVGGMAEVVRQLSEHLSALGHDVVVATRPEPGRSCKEIGRVRVEEFAVSGNLATGMSGDVEGYKTFLIGSQFDIVTNFAAQQWATDIMLPILGQVAGRKVFVPTGFSGLTNPVFEEYFFHMPDWLRCYDQIVFTGREYRDAIFASHHGIEGCVIIPNGASAEEFLNTACCDVKQLLGIPDGHRIVLHVGSHTGLKGHREAMQIFEYSAVRDTTLLIVGNGGQGCFAECSARAQSLNRSTGFGADGKQVLLAELTRPETVAAFKSADLFLFTSSIECSPIVFFECMASKTPFLTTDVGNAREIVEWADAGVVLPTRRNNDLNHPGSRIGNILRDLLDSFRSGQSFSPLEGFARPEIRVSAKILADLLLDRERLRTLAENGFKAWQERFTWERIASRYEELYLRLLSQDRKTL